MDGLYTKEIRRETNLIDYQCLKLNPRKALVFAQKYAYFPKSGTYLSGEVPEYYVCSECGAHHVKLWRGYQDMSPILLCAECAASLEEKDISDIDADGLLDCGHNRTDQIGWQIPAVPLEDIKGYWDYCAVPMLGVQWWRKLPTLQKVP